RDVVEVRDDGFLLADAHDLAPDEIRGRRAAAARVDVEDDRRDARVLAHRRERPDRRLRAEAPRRRALAAGDRPVERDDGEPPAAAPTPEDRPPAELEELGAPPRARGLGLLRADPLADLIGIADRVDQAEALGVGGHVRAALEERGRARRLELARRGDGSG